MAGRARSGVPMAVSENSLCFGEQQLPYYHLGFSIRDWTRPAPVLLICYRFPEDFGKPRLAGRSAWRAQHANRKPSMISGTVKWFNSVKGYGFIAPDDGSPDAFVHISAVERAGISNLAEGQRVQYELQSGNNGKSSAENLSLVG